METKDNEKIFELYKEFIELGKYEVLHAKDRFYNTAKLHLTILASMAVLMSYAVAEHQPIAFVLAIMVSIFGGYNAFNWLGIITSSASWEGRWFHNAGQIEGTEAFKTQTGLHVFEAGHDFPGISNDLVMEKMHYKKDNKGKSAIFYRSFVRSVIFFYIVFVVFSILYKLSSLDKIGPLLTF